MTITLFLLMTLSGVSRDGEVSAEQFVRLMEAQTAPIRDVSYTYEGEMIWIGSAATLGIPLERFGEKFQGISAFRSDGAELFDVYARSIVTPAPVSNYKVSHLKGTLQHLDLLPDQRKVNRGVGVMKSGGSPGSLGGPNSPHVLFYYWLFAILKDPQAYGYRCRGWGDVDGHPCLRVQLNPGWVAEPDDQNHSLYWIDMERGGHPLRVDAIRNGQLSARVDQVRLQEVVTAGQPTVWFPFAARMEGFEWEGTFHSKPVLRETIAVVHGSVVVNQGLADAAFAISDVGKPVKPEARKVREGTRNLALTREFETTPIAPEPRSDPAGVRERLDQELAEADRQARQLEAQAPSREGWGGMVLAQTLLAAIGVSLLVGYGWFRRRN